MIGKVADATGVMNILLLLSRPNPRTVSTALEFTQTVNVVAQHSVSAEVVTIEIAVITIGS